MPPGMRRIPRKPNLAEQTYEALCDAIASGSLGPGERIILDRVANDLGVSPTPLREAIARLVHDGLMVDNADGKLCVVSLTPQYIHDIFWVRAALEGLAAELATESLTNAEIKKVEIALEHTSKALRHGDIQPYIESDSLFHQLITEAAQNSVLLRELEALRVHVALIRRYSQRQSGDHIEKSQEEHVITFAHLKQRNAAEARRSMERHIRRTSDRIVRLIEFAGKELPRQALANTREEVHR